MYFTATCQVLILALSTVKYCGVLFILQGLIYTLCRYICIVLYIVCWVVVSIQDVAKTVTDKKMNQMLQIELWVWKFPLGKLWKFTLLFFWKFL